jgi:pentatricopeptide repeat protein
LLQKMLKEGQTPSTDVLSTMIQRLCRQGDFKGAAKYFQLVVEKGWMVKNESVYYEHFIYGLTKHKKSDKFLAMLGEMRSIKMRHTAKSMKLALQYSLSNKLVDEARRLIAQIKSDGVLPEPDVVHVLFEAHQNGNNVLVREFMDGLRKATNEQFMTKARTYLVQTRKFPPQEVDQMFASSPVKARR